MTLGEWDKVIEKLDEDQKQRYLNAIKELGNWPEFQEHFGFTGLFIIAQSLDHSIKR